MKNYLYILDYSVPQLMEIEIDSADNIDDVFKKYNLKESQVNYLISDTQLSLEKLFYNNEAVDLDSLSDKELKELYEDMEADTYINMYKDCAL